MPSGDKSRYTDKQKRQAEHIGRSLDFVTGPLEYERHSIEHGLGVVDDDQSWCGHR